MHDFASPGFVLSWTSAYSTWTFRVSLRPGKACFRRRVCIVEMSFVHNLAFFILFAHDTNNNKNNFVYKYGLSLFLTTIMTAAGPAKPHMRGLPPLIQQLKRQSHKLIFKFWMSRCCSQSDHQVWPCSRSQLLTIMVGNMGVSLTAMHPDTKQNTRKMPLTWWVMSNHTTMQTCFLILGMEKAHMKKNKSILKKFHSFFDDTGNSQPSWCVIN